MCKACGNAVSSLLIRGCKKCVHNHRLKSRVAIGMDNHRLISKLTTTNPLSYLQPFFELHLCLNKSFTQFPQHLLLPQQIKEGII